MIYGSYLRSLSLLLALALWGYHGFTVSAMAIPAELANDPAAQATQAWDPAEPAMSNHTSRAARLTNRA